MLSCAFYLSEAQDTEEKINSVDYDVWMCPKCAATEIFPFPILNTSFSECPFCHTKAMHMLYNTVQRPGTAARCTNVATAASGRMCRTRYR